MIQTKMDQESSSFSSSESSSSSFGSSCAINTPYTWKQQETVQQSWRKYFDWKESLFPVRETEGRWRETEGGERRERERGSIIHLVVNGSSIISARSELTSWCDLWQTHFIPATVVSLWYHHSLTLSFSFSLEMCLHFFYLSFWSFAILLLFLPPS